MRIVRSVAALLCVLGTTSSGAFAQARSPSETSAVSIPVGQIDQAVGSLDRLAGILLQRTGVPGMAITVVHDDEVVYLKGFGVRKVGTNEPVDPDTVFELASVSKPLGATVIAELVRRGVVKWSDPLSKYLPGFTLSDPYVGRTVTIADMYAHRSGLPDHAGDLLEDLGYDRAAIIKRLALEPLAPFRITYAYTNFGLTAAAQAAANADKTTWEALSNELLYRPLGMRSTSSRFSDYEEAPDRAVLHVRVNGRWIAKFTRDADAQSPAGGASSSARDIAQWLRLELANGKYNGKQVVDEKALLQTRIPSIVSAAPNSPIARAAFYGLGMGISYDSTARLRLSHSGAFLNGAATTVVMLPSENLGIAVLTNGMPIGVPEALAADFMDLAEFGHVERDWYAAYSELMSPLYNNSSILAGKKPPENARPALATVAYTGTYENAYYGPALVENENGRLVIILGPRGRAFPLTHWDGNTFSMLPVGENALGPSAVTFSVAGGRAEKIVVEYLNTEKLGTFTRS